MVNPWHDVSYGDKLPEEVMAFIEVPRDGMLKYEMDKETGLLVLDRAMYSAVHYPGDYGFIPQTLAPDGDATDILIISNFAAYPGTIVKARPIGIIRMFDGEEQDDKVIAMHSTDPRVNHIKSIKDLSEYRILEIKHFFQIYKELQGKKVEITGLEGPEAAIKAIEEGIAAYKEAYPKK